MKNTFFLSVLLLISTTAFAEYIAGRNQATQKVIAYISDNGVYPLQVVDTLKKTLNALKSPFPQLSLVEKSPNNFEVTCQGQTASINLMPESDVGTIFSTIQPVIQGCASSDELKEEVASSEGFENFILGYFVEAYNTKGRYYKPNPLDIYRDGATGAVGLVLSKANSNLEIASTVAGSPAEAAGLKPGDKLIKIGAEETTEMKIEDAALKLRGFDGSQIDLTVIPRGLSDPKVISLKRQNMIIKSVVTDTIGTLGYLKISSFNPNTINDFNSALDTFKEKAVTGIIMDLRNNDGGLIETAIAIADRFLNGNFTIVSLTGQSPQTYKITTKDNQVSLPLTVLINAKTASAAEVLAGALKDNKRAVIIGEKSAGRGSVRTVFSINDYKMEIPVALALTPKGRAIEGSGIDPDKLVTDTTTNFSPAQVGDPVLKAAVDSMASVNKPLNEIRPPASSADPQPQSNH